MVLRKIVEKKWAYTLYESGGVYVLSVTCGDVAMYELNIPLAAVDAERAVSESSYLDQLASEIATSPHKFAQRSINI